jgi:Biotin-requiring enzyme
MDLTNDDVADILALLDSLPYDELDLQTPRFRLTLRRTPGGWTQSTQVLSAPDPITAPPSQGASEADGAPGAGEVSLGEAAGTPGAQATTTMSHRRGQDHDDVTSSWLSGSTGAAAGVADGAGETGGADVVGAQGGGEAGGAGGQDGGEAGGAGGQDGGEAGGAGVGAGGKAGGHERTSGDAGADGGRGGGEARGKDEGELDEGELDEGELVAVTAPLPGTFYRAPRPGAAPFVEVGSRVGADTVIGIVETMKLMNSVHAGVAGEVAGFCVANAEFAERGATLLRIRADP